MRKTPLNTAHLSPGARASHWRNWEKPERVAQIRQDHEQRLIRMRSKVQPNPLRPDSEPLDIDDLYGQAKVCLACHK